MYINKIKPYYSEHNDCFQSVIVSIAKSLNIDYSLLYIGTWNFNINIDILSNKREPLGYLINCTNAHYFIPDILERHHGIKISGDNINVRSEHLGSNISSNGILIVDTNAFHCSWSFCYNKFTTPHCFAIIDEEEDNFIIIDPFFIKKNVFHINKIEIINLNPKIRIIEYKNIISSDQEKIKLIQDYYLGIDCCQIEKNINQFHDLMYNRFDLQIELENHSDIRFVKLIKELKTLMDSRMNNIELLLYLSNLLKINFAKIIEDIEELASKWQTVKILIIKMNYLNEQKQHNTLQEICHLLQIIAKDESKIINTIKSSIIKLF
ncbi:MAG: hypothetical protein PHV32_07875 [Eubacteriales bacterium]|nr:hypothetical protein [Eubacteriales bacterium]